MTTIAWRGITVWPATGGIFKRGPHQHVGLELAVDVGDRRPELDRAGVLGDLARNILDLGQNGPVQVRKANLHFLAHRNLGLVGLVDVHPDEQVVERGDRQEHVIVVVQIARNGVALNDACLRPAKGASFAPCR